MRSVSWLLLVQNFSTMALQEEFEKQGIWLFRRRTYLPILILVVGISLNLQTEIQAEQFFIRSSAYELYYELLCLLIGLFGLFIRIYTVGHAPKNTSGRNVSGQVADYLNTTGSYSLSRHPLYVGNFFMWLSPALLTENLWFIVAFCFLYWVYYERIMFAEEQYLRNKFGERYLTWAKDVPAFVPNFKAFKKSSNAFNWKKVLKAEVNGLFNLFLIFFLFDAAGELVMQKTSFKIVWIIGFLSSGLLFITITTLKKTTSILDEKNR